MKNKIASITKKIRHEDILKFAKISGDFNPIHIDEEYAKKTRFKKRIAHGLYIASFISTVISKKLPGEGSIYVNQSLNFLNPVFINDIITANVQIIEINKNIYTLNCECINQNKITVIEGIAKVYFKNKPVV